MVVRRGTKRGTPVRATARCTGLAGTRGLWDPHGPYDVTQTYVHTPEGWITVLWTREVASPLADVTWSCARRVAPAHNDCDAVSQTETARAPWTRC